MSKTALITGVTGQDGSYLAELLLQKGYEVHGMVRRSSTETFERISHLRGRWFKNGTVPTRTRLPDLSKPLARRGSIRAITISLSSSCLWRKALPKP